MEPHLWSAKVELAGQEGADGSEDAGSLGKGPETLPETPPEFFPHCKVLRAMGPQAQTPRAA